MTTVTVDQAKSGIDVPRVANYMMYKPLLDIPPFASTLHQNFIQAMEQYPYKPFLGQKETKNAPFKWQTYMQVFTRIHHLGSGLVSLNVVPKDYVGVYSKNCPDWVIGEQACFMYNFVTVPLYDTLGTEALKHILSQTKMTVCFVGKEKLANLVNVLKEISPMDTYLQTLIIINQGPQEDDTIDNLIDNLHVVKITQVEDQGKLNKNLPSKMSDPDDIATICYTSGTTGNPKGVMLTHRNILSCTYSISYAANLGHYPKITSEDTHLSYLPMAHVFERTVQVYFIMHGARIGFYSGDPKTIQNDTKDLQPTCFVSVPRLYNRIYDETWKRVNNQTRLKRFVFKLGYKYKLWKWRQTNNLKSTIFDPIFKDVKDSLGGKVRFMMTGSAPLAPHVQDFLRVCFSCHVHQGYGLTETAGGVSITVEGDVSLGHVGIPLGCCMVKLLPVLDSPLDDNDTGEICVKGAQVFQGYLNDTAKTSEAIDDDGWFHTGDIGKWNEYGYLVVVDRIKTIFKLSQGEYIKLEHIESTYTNHPLVFQAFIYGDPNKSSLVAIIVPDKENFINWAQRHDTENMSFKELCSDNEIKLKFLDELRSYAKQQGLQGFEQVQGVTLEPEQFTVENDLMTPTFKLKWYKIKQRYQDQIDAMYNET